MLQSDTIPAYYSGATYMNRVALLAVAIGFVLSIHPVNAQNAPVGDARTGVQLLHECEVASNENANLSPAEEGQAEYCIAYLDGLTDAFAFWRFDNDKHKGQVPPPACIPTGVTNFELAKVVVKYLNDHPNSLHDSYRVLAVVALQVAYPCNK